MKTIKFNSNDVDVSNFYVPGKGFSNISIGVQTTHKPTKITAQSSGGRSYYVNRKIALADLEKQVGEYYKNEGEEMKTLEEKIVELEKQLDTTPDFIKVGNGTLHGAIDHWQGKYGELNASLPKIKAEAIRDAVNELAKVKYTNCPNCLDYEDVCDKEDFMEYADKIERGEAE